MAHDIFSGDNSRDWSRGSDNASSTSGRAPFARSLFERRSCAERPVIVVKQERASIGWLGATLAVMGATRIVSGKWPWYWAGLAAKKLDTSHSPQKG
jgi:hypothetical protein